MQKITIKLLAIILFAGILYACGDNQEDETKIEDDVVVDEITAPDYNDEVEYVLPSPLQIAELFKNSGLSYIGDLTNTKDRIETYITKKDQKLNFGVYSADMAYCIMNNQTQESINYLNTLRLLSEKLWMTDILNSMGLSARLEANIGNEDSLTFIMADLQMQLDDYLEENGISNTGSVIFAGAWIETMYLGSRVIESEKNDKLVSRVSEQAVILQNLIASIKQTDENNDFADLVTDLENINKHFSRFDSESEEDYIMTDEEIKSLSIDIATLRGKLVGDK